MIVSELNNTRKLRHSTSNVYAIFHDIARTQRMRAASNSELKARKHKNYLYVRPRAPSRRPPVPSAWRSRGRGRDSVPGTEGARWREIQTPFDNNRKLWINRFSPFLSEMDTLSSTWIDIYCRGLRGGCHTWNDTYAFPM